MAQAFGPSGPGWRPPGRDFWMPDGGRLTRYAGAPGDIGRRRMTARGARPVDPGSGSGGAGSRLELEHRRPGSRAARRSARAARAAIGAAQKKTPGAGPGVRWSRAAARGSGVELLDQLKHAIESLPRLFDAPGAEHQQGELKPEPEPLGHRLNGRLIGGDYGGLDLHH